MRRSLLWLHRKGATDTNLSAVTMKFEPAENCFAPKRKEPMILFVLSNWSCCRGVDYSSSLSWSSVNFSERSHDNKFSSGRKFFRITTINHRRKPIKANQYTSITAVYYQQRTRAIFTITPNLRSLATKHSVTPHRISFQTFFKLRFRKHRRRKRVQTESTESEAGTPGITAER